MRVMVDSNVIVSALLFRESLPAKVLLCISNHHDLVLCDHIITEVWDTTSRKRPDLLSDFDVLLAQLSYELVMAPKAPSKLIQDPKDQPILNAAMLAGVDIIVSGDKHFLKLELEQPRTMSPAEFWQLEQNC